MPSKSGPDSASSRPSANGPIWRRRGTITVAHGDSITRLVSSATGYAATAEGDGPSVEWLSTDGRAWDLGAAHEATPPCPPIDPSCSAWAVADGWEAIASSTDPISILRSADGVTWTAIDVPADVAADLDGTGWAAPDGTLLLLLDPSHLGTAVSLGEITSAGDWRAVSYPATCPSSFALVLAPTDAGQPRWAISDGWTVCVSTDLQTWTMTRLRVAAGYPIADWISTREGILATGSNSDCICDRPFQLLSADGERWTRVRAAIGTLVMADGPAGILGITDDTDAAPDRFPVWSLTP